MKHLYRVLLVLPVLLAVSNLAAAEDAKKAAPLRVLIVAGGCCHDYASQSKILKAGIEERINAKVTVVLNLSKSTGARFEIYKNPGWANAFDVILHDECSASVTDKDYVKRILDAHKDGKPAVNLHCAMHSYRWGDFRQAVKLGAENAGWFEMIGLQSTGHGPQAPIDVAYEDDHPVTKGLKDWTTINEELYNNVHVFKGTTVLGNGTQTQKPRARELKENPNAKPRVSKAVVVWANEFGPNKTKIFSTSLGHNNDTVADDRYLDLVVRGLLWTTGNLTEDGKPADGYGK
jgi:type 1 glutamine amidotransferase